MQLSGPPRLAGIVRRLAGDQGPITDDWDDQSTYLDGRLRKLRKGRAQLWPSWSLTIVATDAEWLAWRSDLRGDADGEFDWCPRTRKPSDPEWLEEHVYRARVQGGLRTLSPLRQRNQQGVMVYVVDVVVEGVEPYEREPDAVSGGYTLISQTTTAATLRPYGDATIEPGPSETVTWPDGTQTTIETAVLGPPAITAARTTQQGDTLRIATRTP